MSTLSRSARASGFTLLEITIGMGIMTCAMVAFLETMGLFSTGMRSETTQSDLRCRTAGTMYDMITELRQATAYSPHFKIQTDPTLPPSMTFDLVNGVDSQGNILWGNMVTYRLVQGSYDGVSESLGVVPGQLLRDETPPLNGTTVTAVAADRVPYQYLDNSGAKQWGFTVSCDASALTLALSRFGDVGASTGGLYQGTSTTSKGTGTVSIVTQQGVYFLRNPQAVMNLN